MLAMAADVFIALGTNLDDRLANLRAAGQALGEEPTFQGLCWSEVYETLPVGGPPGQDNFFNAVVRLAAGSAPERTLQTLKSLERRLGRVETEPWGPRLIDLDLLLHGQVVLNSPELTLPHPRLHLRRFVLLPLADLAPQIRHPVLGQSIGELLARLGEDHTVIRRVDWRPAAGPLQSPGPFSGLETTL